MTPLEASELSKHKEKRLMNDQYSNSLGPIGKPKFELTDWVRVLRTKDKFEKGYTARWSKEIFQIVRIDVNKPITYYLKDENGDMEKGFFYKNELQKTKQKPEVPAPLTNEIKINDWKYIETKSKKKFADIEVHVMVDGKWQWKPILDYLVPIKGDKNHFNIHSIAKFVHHELFNEVWRNL